MKLPPARLLEVSADEYFALPGLSASRAKVIHSQSERHAKDHVEKNPTKEMDFGSVVHRLTLGKGKDYEVLRYDDYRTKAAQADRDKARAAGKVPILYDAHEQACLCAEKIRVELADRDIVLDGESEQAIEWWEPSEHGPVQCRAMLDHVWIEAGAILDLKVTDDAAPSAVERTSENLGYAIQYAAYTSALVALLPELAGRTDFLFAFCEPEAPHAMNLSRPDGMFREVGMRRWRRCVEKWARCLATNEWPAYGAGVNSLSSPAWAAAKEMI